MRVLLLIATLFFAPGIWAQSDYAEVLDFTRYVYKFEDGRVTERGIFRVPVPGVNEIERDRPQFNTYPQFLDYLFNQAPSLKDHFVILHHSASLQMASLQHPRLILFDGGKAFAFSEHPENRALKVELIETSPIDYSLSMAEITFAREGGVKIERNPKACVACHGRPAKLLWDPYDFWPNAFGSSVGAMSSVQEKVGYEALRSRASQSEILKRLNLPNGFDLGAEENTPFSQYVGQINLASQLGRALQSRDLNGWRFPLLSILSSCHSKFDTKFSEAKPALLQLFRPEERAEVESRLNRLYSDLVIARAHMKTTQASLLSAYFPNPTSLFKIDHERLHSENADLAMIRTIFESVGINLNNLSTSHLANDYFIANPSHILLDMTAVLNDVAPEIFVNLGINPQPQDVGTGIPGWVSFDCEMLKQQSLIAERSPPTPMQWRPLQAPKNERPVINRCAKCHTEGFDDEAPFIPFNDSLELAKWLRDPAKRLGQKIMDRVQRTGPGQMPPGKPLTPEEIDSLREMIEALR